MYFMGIKSIVYELYSDLFETTPIPIARIEAALSVFNRNAALLRLSQINILLAMGRLEGSSNKLQDTLCRVFFDDAIIERINDKYASKRNDSPTFFFRLLVLFMMRVCARACPTSEEANKIDSLEERYAFGWCCLWITDHLATEADQNAISDGSDESRRKALGPQIGVLLELGTPPNLRRAIARADIMFSEIARDRKVIKESGGFELLTAFEKATGITIELYCDLVFFIIGWFYGHSIEQMFEDTSKFVIHFDTYFSNTTIGPEAINKFLDLTAVSSHSFPVHLSNQKGADNRDFSAIQSKPLLSLNNGAIACLDVDFLVEKLSTGVYWLIDERFTESDKGRAKGAWGYLFQAHVNRIFNEIYPQTRSNMIAGAFTASPKYTTREEAFDAIHISPTNPRHLFVFQYKSQLFKPERKFSAESELFELALDSTGFGQWQKGGLKQLVDNIELLWGQGPRKQLRPPFDSLSGYEKITPILIVQESFFRGDFLNWTLNNRFQALLASSSISAAITIEPLMVIDIESLELLKPYVLSGACTFSQAVNSLNAFDRERLASFRRHLSTYLDQFPKATDETVKRRFESIMARVKRHFKDS